LSIAGRTVSRVEVSRHKLSRVMLAGCTVSRVEVGRNEISRVEVSRAQFKVNKVHSYQIAGLWTSSVQDELDTTLARLARLAGERN
jgi:hypothetical protein